MATEASVNLSIEANAVMWLGRDSRGKWWWSLVAEQFNGRSGANGYECKMDAIEDCVRAFRAAITDRINAMEKTNDEPETQIRSRKDGWG